MVQVTCSLELSMYECLCLLKSLVKTEDAKCKHLMYISIFPFFFICITYYHLYVIRMVLQTRNNTFKMNKHYSEGRKYASVAPLDIITIAINFKFISIIFI